MKLSLLTGHASVCNATVGFESGDTGKRGCGTAALCTTTLVMHQVLPGGRYCISLSHSFSTHCRAMRNHMWHALSKVLRQSPDLIASLAGSLSGFFTDRNMWSIVAQLLTQITSPAATPDHLWQLMEAA
ncbi:hypothetical protein TNCV_3533961 [Trichonephila clavipes]|nr:hypothetical protein TNCV_3533961 [Trichonephila clavipes]